MSEVISHLAEPILDEVGDAPEDIERVISLTVAAWNLTLFPAETREQQFDDLSRKFFDRDPEAVKVLRLVCDVVSKRKQQYYPHVNHLIFDVQFRREANDGVYFEVAYNLEPTGPRPSERASNG